MRQDGAFELGHYLIIKHNDVRAQVEGAAPEEDRAVEVEVQPEFQFVVSDVGDVGPAHVDREPGAWAKHNERIIGCAVDKYLIAAANEDLDLEDLSGGDQAR